MDPVSPGGTRNQEVKEDELPLLTNIAADPRIREHLRNVSARLCRGNVIPQRAQAARAARAGQTNERGF
jgi:hypothetical protein